MTLCIAAVIVIAAYSIAATLMFLFYIFFVHSNRMPRAIFIAVFWPFYVFRKELDGCPWKE